MVPIMLVLNLMALIIILGLGRGTLPIPGVWPSSDVDQRQVWQQGN